jgi:hypothetical protein
MNRKRLPSTVAEAIGVAVIVFLLALPKSKAGGVDGRQVVVLTDGSAFVK